MKKDLCRLHTLAKDWFHAFKNPRGADATKLLDLIADLREMVETLEKLKDQVKYVFEGPMIGVETEDSGHAKFGELSDTRSLFVMIKSWVDYGQPPVHIEFDSLMHKRLRVTIEVIE